MVRVCCLVGCLLGMAADSSLKAADLPKSAVVQSPQFDWPGWYVGAHVGVIRGASNWSATPPGAGAPALNGSFDLPFNFDFMAGTGSYVAGLQAGYNYVFPSRWMLGFEVDVPLRIRTCWYPIRCVAARRSTSPLTGQVTYGEAVIHYGTARARVGYAFDHFLLYGTGGLAWSYDQVTRTQVAGNSFGGFASPGTVDTKLLWRLGWAAGVGVEIPIAGNWTAKAEYLSTGFGRKGLIFPTAMEGFASDLAMQSIRLGLNYRIGRQRPRPGLPDQGTIGAGDGPLRVPRPGHLPQPI